MKLLRFLALPLLVLAMSSPAWADDINIIFDPVQGIPFDGGYLINQQGVNYTVTWGSCDPSVNTSLALATDFTTFMANNTPAGMKSGCLAFVNGTGAPITEVDLTIVSNGLSNDNETFCQSIDVYLTNATCTGSLSEGGVTLTFNGGSSIPPSTQTMASMFFIGEIGVDPSLITTDVSAPTYDPSTLVLLLVGMTILGMYGMRRYA